jgi:TDG/mug DNA glycosylase family protein
LRFPNDEIDLRKRRTTWIPSLLHSVHQQFPEGHSIHFVFSPRWKPQRVSDVLVGAGFSLQAPSRDADSIRVTAKPIRTLSDTVSSNMRLLLVGLNPSFHAADAGYGFAGPSNRFWSAALEAQIVSKERDSIHALRIDRVGMTDLVKKPTSTASELTDAQFRIGLARVSRMCGWLRPKAICVLGITGWRAALGDSKLSLGAQIIRLGGRPVYVLPNPSGLNAHTNHGDMVKRFRDLLGSV